jgi:cell division protein FtsX
MSRTEVSLNVVEEGSNWASTPLLILLASIVIAVIAFLIGLNWLRRRRHEHEGEHLVADIAEPESLRELPPEQRP